MPYPAVSSRRMAYDIDGTVIGYNTSGYNNSFTWFSSNQITSLNLEDTSSYIIDKSTNDINWYIWIFFPEKREIEACNILMNAQSSTFKNIQGSNNSTNGIDGTWETATLPSGSPLYPNSGTTFWWRDNIKPISFSEPKKIIRLQIYTVASSTYRSRLKKIHLYGKKASTETPDDIIILDNELATPAEFTVLKDWGDRPEGTTVINSVRIQNASSTKTANNINLQLNHADFLISFDSAGSWGTVLDILSLAPGAVSSPIYIKNQLGPPLLTLGPKAARLITAVGSWT